MTSKDKRGKDLDGGATYRLRVPPNAPVTLLWSATAYDRATPALIRNRGWSSRSSQSPDLQIDPDGSLVLLRRKRQQAGRAELGAYPPRREVRNPVSALRTREAVLREEMDSSRCRESSHAMTAGASVNVVPVTAGQAFSTSKPSSVCGYRVRPRRRCTDHLPACRTYPRAAASCVVMKSRTEVI